MKAIHQKVGKQIPWQKELFHGLLIARLLMKTRQKIIKFYFLETLKNK